VLKPVADGVLVHGSEFSRSNAVVVEGTAGVLLIDAGVLAEELTCLSEDLRGRGTPVVAGFSTHPHWDHLLWHPALGAAPRYGTVRCAAVVEALLANDQWGTRVAGVLPADLAERIPLEGFGRITGLAEPLGHGSVGGAEAMRERIDQDRTYLLALQAGDGVRDPRIGPSAEAGWEWVRGVHEQQVLALAQREGHG
jgi:hypothetical protein